MSTVDKHGQHWAVAKSDLLLLGKMISAQRKIVDRLHQSLQVVVTTMGLLEEELKRVKELTNA